MSKKKNMSRASTTEKTISRKPLILQAVLDCLAVLWAASVFLFLPVVGFPQTQFFTPDAKENQALLGKDIKTISYFGIEDLGEKFILKPALKSDWRWIAAKNIPHPKGAFSAFVMDGYVYANFKGDIRSSLRRVKARKDITALVQSNAFHIAFENGEGKDEEVILFIATTEKKRVEILIDKSVFGAARRLVYSLAAGDARLLKISHGEKMNEWQPLAFPTKPARRRIDFTQEWKFTTGNPKNAESVGFNDSKWERVALPHTWNATDQYDDRNLNDGLDIYANYYRGDAWYRKTFTPPDDANGKKLWIEFEAANQTAEVWLNGKPLGKHIGGFLNFKFDLTDKLMFGKPNVVAVKVNNAYSPDIPPHVGDFNMPGGLNREASLHITNNTHIESVAITTPAVSKSAASLNAVTQVRNDGETKTLTLATNLISPEGYIVATMTTTATVEKFQTHLFTQSVAEIAYPALWSPESPVLYQVVSRIYDTAEMESGNRAPALDEITTNIGFRWFEFTADKGFFLNGKRLQLCGVNLHQDRFGYGNAVPDSVRVQDLRLFKAMGINFVRLAHYPHDESMLDECDRLGIIVYTEIPYVNSVGREAFFENTKTMLRELIRRDRNHPSIVFWGVANETIEPWLTDEDLKLCLKLIAELHALAKSEDPTRLTIQAQNTLADTSVMNLTDVVGRNRYSGWYQRTIEDFGKIMDEEHRLHPHWKILISEYGADAKRGFHVDDPQRMDFSETYQVKFHEGYLKQLGEREWIAGGAVWNGADFASHAKQGNIPRINEKGLVDYKRVPKDAYYLYQSKWSQKPMAYIVSHTRTRLFGKPNEIKPLRVFTNCDSLELFHNGKSLGMQKATFVWNVQWSEGEHVFTAKGTKRGDSATDQLNIDYIIGEPPHRAMKLKKSDEKGGIE